MCVSACTAGQWVCGRHTQQPGADPSVSAARHPYRSAPWYVKRHRELAAAVRWPMYGLAARVVAWIRIDVVWLATELMDVRAGTNMALARVVRVFSAAHPYQAYLVANRRANRIEVIVHDGIGIRLAARRLHQGHVIWPSTNAQAQASLSRAQLFATVLLGLDLQIIAKSA